MQPLFGSPLVRWDGAHLVLRLELVERRLAELLRPVAERVRDIRLEGEGDVVRVHATVVWKGRGARVAVDLGEVRLRHRRLGFRVGRVRVMGGVPLPRAAVLAVCRALRSPLLTVVGGPDMSGGVGG